MLLHEQYMHRCLQLAEKGLGNVAPNPMVGCVIVCNGQIIGEGYHQQYGQAHAEVNAIRSVTDETLLPEATLYVNLEPCSHHGKTPPCANLIIEKKIKRVVIGSYDPNPLVAGKGIALLQQHGIEVITEVCKTEADYLNRRFFTYHTQHRPYIILKWAQSADGYIAPLPAAPLWLTSDESKKLVHRWRTQEQAIMVGTNTAITDNPQLTARLWPGKNPLRVVIDRKLNLPSTLHLLDGSTATLVVNEKENSTHGNTERVKIDFSSNAEQQILYELYKRNIISVIIEGGATLLNSFIQKQLWDEARIFTSPTFLHQGLVAPMVNGHTISDIKVGEDRLVVVRRVANNG
jgi:diaminohydroxyphosphoribosylaminopyrimidine deaminase/5-amino-6-(5-phosphoribosylamino)uracil reductase